MKGNAINESAAMIDAHLSFALESGGVVVLCQELVFIGSRWDPVAGDDEHTLAVMYVRGDARLLAGVARLALREGMTDVCWCRECCRGDSRLRKVKLERFLNKLEDIYGE